MYRMTKRFTAKHCLFGILAVAFVVRLATALWLGNSMEVLPAGGTHDQVSYDMLAHRVATGHGFTFPQAWYPWVPPDIPTAYYSGTMVIHLAAIYYMFGYNPLIARILYVFLGTLICWFLFRIGRRLFGEVAGLVTAAMAAGYAYLILYSATLLTETPFILFLLMAIDNAYLLRDRVTAKRLVTFGLALGGAVVFRMAVLPFVVLMLIWLYTETRKAQVPLRIWQLLIPLGLIIAAVLPWTIRNYLIFDRFLLLESQFGHVFWNSNHPDQGYTFDEVGWVAPIPPELMGWNEVDLTNELLRRGIRNVLSDPLRYISLTLSRMRIFFAFWPTAGSSWMSNVARALSFGVSLPFMAYGLILSLRRWRVFLPLYIFLILHLGVYLASWVMIRYRIPADTILLLFAGLAAVDLHHRAFHRRAILDSTISPADSVDFIH